MVVCLVSINVIDYHPILKVEKSGCYKSVY